jgi:uncharacterized protein YutE (UPF0331/DUF86 family)
MSLKWNGVIQRKLALLDQQIVRIEEHLRGVTRERFVADWAMRSLCERAIQVSVEIVIDVAERIVALAGVGPVATARDAIERLVHLEVLQHADPYRGMVGLRNVIVHGYEEVDPNVLFDVVTQRLGDFRRFRDEVDRANAVSGRSA